MISKQPTAKNTTDHQHFQRAAALALGRKQFLEESDRAYFLKRPDNPAGEEDQSHGERQVDVGIGAAEQRLIDSETIGGLVPPADRADSRNEADPIGGKDENENGRKKPKRPLDQMRANDSFQKTVETLNQPFQEILRSSGNMLHVPRSDLGKNDQAQPPRSKSRPWNW